MHRDLTRAGSVQTLCPAGPDVRARVRACVRVDEGGGLNLGNVATYEPFVVREFVAMLVRGDDVHQEDVLGFRVESCDLHLVAGEHPPTGNQKNTFTIPKPFITMMDEAVLQGGQDNTALN